MLWRWRAVLLGFLGAQIGTALVETIEDEDEEDLSPVLYKGPGVVVQQCDAGGGPANITTLLEQVGRGVDQELLDKVATLLFEEGVKITPQLCELHPTDFEAIRLPALLKSRLRRVRERGGKVPPDLLDSHGTPGQESDEVEAPSEDTDGDLDMEGHEEL
mmetsp:Transcript_42147/g.76402  ORF Transcript_42147/g.76402 Transcript_42147/m.76402 type:complete len:160 (-) Transcript_42147:88-567(-)